MPVRFIYLANQGRGQEEARYALLSLDAELDAGYNIFSRGPHNPVDLKTS